MTVIMGKTKKSLLIKNKKKTGLVMLKGKVRQIFLRKTKGNETRTDSKIK